jgi:hypothetical protein
VSCSYKQEEEEPEPLSDARTQAPLGGASAATAAGGPEEELLTTTTSLPHHAAELASRTHEGGKSSSLDRDTGLATKSEGGAWPPGATAARRGGRGSGDEAGAEEAPPLASAKTALHPAGTLGPPRNEGSHVRGRGLPIAAIFVRVKEGAPASSFRSNRHRLARTEEEVSPLSPPAADAAVAAPGPARSRNLPSASTAMQQAADPAEAASATRQASAAGGGDEPPAAAMLTGTAKTRPSG